MKLLYDQLGTTWNFFVMDYRGAGRSQRMSCEPAQFETVASEWGTNISPNEALQCAAFLGRRNAQAPNATLAYTVDETAMDLGNLIAPTRGNASVNLYGWSYGTFVVHRYTSSFFARRCRGSCHGRHRLLSVLPRTEVDIGHTGKV